MKKKIIKESAITDARHFIGDAVLINFIENKINDILFKFSNLNRDDRMIIKKKILDMLWLAAKQFVKDAKKTGKKLTQDDIEILLDNLHENYFSKLNKKEIDKQDIDALFKSFKNGLKNKLAVETILEKELALMKRGETKYNLDGLSLEVIRKLGKKAIKRGNGFFKELLKQYESRGELTALYDAPDCVIYLINSIEAAVASGAFTEWCTAITDSGNLFERYDVDGLSLIWFPNEKHTYVWNKADITFGKRFGVTLLNFPIGEAQTEENAKVPEEVKDLLVKHIGEEKTNEILGKTEQNIKNRDKQKALKAIEQEKDLDDLFLEEVQKNNLELTELLLKEDADVNVKDEYGWNALMYAVNEGNPEIVRLLLDSGIKLNEVDKNGWTALLRAISDNKEEIIKMLIEAGADVNIRNKRNDSVLLYASKRCNKDIVEMIIEHGADINAVDREGNTALIYAVDKNKIDMVVLLIKSGADINTRNIKNKNALMIAIRNGNKKIANLLLEAGADIK